MLWMHTPGVTRGNLLLPRAVCFSNPVCVRGKEKHAGGQTDGCLSVCQVTFYRTDVCDFKLCDTYSSHKMQWSVDLSSVAPTIDLWGSKGSQLSRELLISSTFPSPNTRNTLCCVSYTDSRIETTVEQQNLPPHKDHTGHTGIYVDPLQPEK